VYPNKLFTNCGKKIKNGIAVLFIINITDNLTHRNQEKKEMSSDYLLNKTKEV
jgi:hypothetical protein